MARKLGPAQPRGTTWNGAGGCADLLAVPARELLAHRLDDLPRARDHLQRLGHVLAELRQPRAAAGRAGARRRDHDALARQVLGERLPDGPLALEGSDVVGPGCRFLGDQIVLGGVGLEIFELQLHLVEQAAAAFGAGAILLAPELGDLQLEVGDQGLDGALTGMGVGQAWPLPRRLFAGHRRHQRLERFDIVRKGRNGGFHGPE
jgi:hypothetical protein